MYPPYTHESIHSIFLQKDSHTQLAYTQEAADKKANHHCSQHSLLVWQTDLSEGIIKSNKNKRGKLTLNNFIACECERALILLL